MNHTRIYFDNAATTPVHPEVLAAMEPYWSNIFGNASSPYAVAREARMALDVARTQVARLIGAHADEIVWTGGGTEADNWALWGIAAANRESGGHFIVSAIEHHAVIEPAEALRSWGFEVDFAPPNAQGIVEAEAIGRLLRPETKLVSLMAANNETGVAQPVAEVARIVKEHGALFHVDATQIAGKTLLDVDYAFENEQGGGADLMTISAHKLHGPKGVGALYVRRGTAMRPFMYGGAQERGRRSGTENVPAIVGFGAAAKCALDNLKDNVIHLEALRHRAERGLRYLEGVEIIAEKSPRAPHIISFILPGIRAESLAINLDLKGIAVGTGSACASGALEPSHVLAAMGYSREQAKSALRVSFGVQNTLIEVDEFLEILAALPGIKRISGTPITL